MGKVNNEVEFQIYDEESIYYKLTASSSST